jgi:hypothetical protein
MDRHVVREQNLDHDVPALSVQLLEYDDGSVEFSGVSYRFRTEDGELSAPTAGKFDGHIRCGDSCSRKLRTAVLNDSGWSIFAACPASSMTTLREDGMWRCM